MKEYIEKAISELKTDIVNKEQEKKEISQVLQELEDNIKEETIAYFHTDNIEEKEVIKRNLTKAYNLLYYYQSKTNGQSRAYLLSDNIRSLPEIYTIEQTPKRFDIESSLLIGIDAKKGLTPEQAYELLKWTANNTRDNLNIISKKDGYETEDVYENNSLLGYCGFSQFSSLYPLQKLGLKVTINNVGSVVNGGRHAFGTVTIPITTEQGIVNKTFIIDCTYRQFFSIKNNIISKYLNGTPDPAFFIEQDFHQKEFAKNLLMNGFAEATEENLAKYLKSFFALSMSLNSVSNIEEEFNKLNLTNVLENIQEEFDYEEEEFTAWGLNLEVPKAKKNLL